MKKKYIKYPKKDVLLEVKIIKEMTSYGKKRYEVKVIGQKGRLVVEKIICTKH